MKSLALAAALLTVPVTGYAQRPAHQPGMAHHTTPAAPAMRGAAAPTEAGQSAFAAIQEIVARLEADPRTDWSKVDIEALRQHLIDMDSVTLHAVVAMEPVEGGARFTVTGTGAVKESIRRMVTAHAATMTGSDGWTFIAADHADGAVLTVTAGSPAVAIKVRALGFIGVMTRGMHHQMHHMMVASGGNPHLR